MAKTIGAKCFSCGYVTRVPAQFGGRRFDCPGCAEIVVVPRPSDSGRPVISDDQLPMVAQDGVDLFEESEFQPIEEMDEIEDVPQEEGEEDQDRIALQPSRPGAPPVVVAMPRPQTRRVRRTGRVSRSTEFRRPKSSLPVILTVVAIAFLLIIVLIAVSSK